MPTLGAIRWDAWQSGPVGVAESLMLSPSQWQYRCPFYSVINSSSSVTISHETQQIENDQIRMAHAGGIDYFAFDFYPDDASMGFGSGSSFLQFMGSGLTRYMASPYKGLVKFCLLTAGHFGFTGTFASTDWPATADVIVNFMRDPAYMTVLSGRPLFYFYFAATYSSAFANNAAARAGVTTFRNKCTAAGLGNPYIVQQMGDTDIGADCWGDYAAFTTGSISAHPYTALQASAESAWVSNAAFGPQRMIPHVTAGWDYRPRHSSLNPYDSAGSGENIDAAYTVRPTPSELAQHVQNSFDFITSHATNCPAQTALLYAWNEFSEGGWVCPTLADKGSMLAAIGQKLKRQKDRKKALIRRGMQITTK